MLKFLDKRPSLAYDDVLIVPARSSVESRNDVDISAKLGYNRFLKIPIMSAAMDTITDARMAEEMAILGGLGVIHRFQSMKVRIAQADYISKIGLSSVAVGLDDSIEDIANLREVCDIVALDVAHAHCERVINKMNQIKTVIGDSLLMVGNIATERAAFDLIKAGADILKVGIGSGAACKTRDVAGCGVPNISAILAVRDQLDIIDPDRRVKIVADGGIRKPADAAKAFAAGADCVMIGSMLAGTDEVPESAFLIGSKYKFRGMASDEAQRDWKGIRPGIAAEGVSTTVKKKGPAKNVIGEICSGIRSACSYVGAHTLDEFYDISQFVIITNAGIIESRPHILDYK